MSRFISSHRLPGSVLVIPRRRLRHLILCTFALSTICLLSIAMVTQIQDLEQRANEYHPDSIVYSNSDSNLQQEPAVKYRNLVARETLAVGDDYQDLSVNSNKKSNQKLDSETARKLQYQNVKNETKSFAADESLLRQRRNATLQSNGEKHGDRVAFRNARNRGVAKNHPSNSLLHGQQQQEDPFVKTADANGEVVFEITNKLHDGKNGRPLVKFYHEAAKKKTADSAKLRQAVEDSYYGYEYDENAVNKHKNRNNREEMKRENSELEKGGFQYLPKKNDKLMIGNNDKSPDSETNIINKHSNETDHHISLANPNLHVVKEGDPHFADVKPVQQENWPNLHQMRKDNNEQISANKNKSAPHQFVVSAGRSSPGGLRSVKNINIGISNEDAAVEHANNLGGGNNLFQGIMGNDQRDEVGRTQPCVKGEACRETDTDTNEQKIKSRGTAKMNHHYPLVKLSLGDDGTFEKLQEESLKNKIDKNSFGEKTQKVSAIKDDFKPNGGQNNELAQGQQGRLVDYLNNHAKIETQIPIQDGPGLVPVEYPATQLQYPGSLGQSISLLSQQGMPLVLDGIYWSKEAMALVPPGLSEKDFQDFLKAVSSEKVASMEKASWNKCGRPKNQYIQLESGRHMCARYRDNFKMIQGEILSFYLSRFLGFDNIPPVALSLVDSNATRWQHVKAEIAQAAWNEKHIINQIMWIDFIGRQAHTKMPPLILKAFEGNTSVTWHEASLSHLSANEISELIQWSDMLLFDYITGNYDRIASMQDGAEHEHKPEIMHETMRNLPKDSNGKLWLIDNESGLLDAYNLIISPKQKFHRFHREMLQTLCIFNRKTVSKIVDLAKFSEPHQLLVNFVEEQEPLYKLFPMDYKEYTLFTNLFHTRLKDIIAWVNHCKSR